MSSELEPMNNGLYPLDCDIVLPFFSIFTFVHPYPSAALPSDPTSSATHTTSNSPKPQKSINISQNHPKTLTPPPHNMGKSSTKGNGENKAVKALLDRPVQIKKTSKAEAKPKEEEKPYTGPQTRSRTKAALEAELEQK
ncbi:hypothetical protein EPUS_04242 [Endocarpon pusillum Z07020]|uniref:Uncharacterized protein n=1 Tax=Endocarpon pusillum (strain Z07020 / HMAS-L-300199) TaxID=1263415 RepID=U1G625_ENDPU|nr:uncharacterized protein EPUS_04242 [Endocarpon pusillum Z07020]ERF72807.1 hypothetical protein EPUS_04242 [Endocarpon pusillum Z07020]